MIRCADFSPAVYDFPVYDGKHYSWFFGANPRLIFYNADLFKKEASPCLRQSGSPPAGRSTTSSRRRAS